MESLATGLFIDFLYICSSLHSFYNTLGIKFLSSTNLLNMKMDWNKL